MRRCSDALGPRKNLHRQAASERQGMGYGTRPHDWKLDELEYVKFFLCLAVCVHLTCSCTTPNPSSPTRQAGVPHRPSSRRAPRQQHLEIRIVIRRYEDGSHKHVPVLETLVIGSVFGRHVFMIRRTPTNFSKFLPYRRYFFTRHGICPVRTGSDRLGLQWWCIHDLRLESGRKGQTRRTTGNTVLCIP
jgi:hypothetical protein